MTSETRTEDQPSAILNFDPREGLSKVEEIEPKVASCIFKTRIRTIDDLHMASGGRLKIDKLSNSPVEGSITSVVLDGCVLSFSDYSGHLRMRGILSDRELSVGLLFDDLAGCHGVAPDEAGMGDRWFRPAKPDGVGFWPPGLNIDVIHKSGTSSATVRLERERIYEVAERERIKLPKGILRKNLSLRNCRSFGAHLRALKLDLSFQDGTSPDESWKARTSHSLIAALLQLIVAEQVPKGQLPNIGHSERIVSNAISYLDLNTHRPITLDHLSTALNVPRRSLTRAFKSVTALSPSVYARRQRLNCVRRQLLTSPVTELVSVSRTATKFGFFHFGRFARQYFELFGEKPSETMQNQNPLRGK